MNLKDERRAPRAPTRPLAACFLFPVLNIFNFLIVFLNNTVIYPEKFGYWALLVYSYIIEAAYIAENHVINSIFL